MRKIISILLITLFLVGTMPAAFAERDSERTNERKENLKEARETYKAQREEARETFKTEREAVKERLNASREEAKQAVRVLRETRKEEFKESRDAFKESRKNLIDTRSKARDCKAKDSEECKKLMMELRGVSHKHILNSIQHMIELLEKTKLKLEKSEVEGKAELLVKIEGNIKQAKEIYAQLEAIENPTNEQVREAASKVKQLLKDSKSHVREGSNKVINVRIAGVLTKSQQLYDRLVKVVNKLEKDGYDVSVANEKIKSFKDNLVKAEDEYKLAVATEKNARSADEVMKEAHKHLKLSHQYLKAAHNDLKEAVRLIKSTKQEALEETENKTTEEVEE